MGCVPYRNRVQIINGRRIIENVQQGQRSDLESSKIAHRSELGFGPSLTNRDKSLKAQLTVQKNPSKSSVKSKLSDKLFTVKLMREFEKIKALEDNLYPAKRSTQKFTRSNLLEQIKPVSAFQKLFTIAKQKYNCVDINEQAKAKTSEKKRKDNSKIHSDDDIPDKEKQRSNLNLTMPNIKPDTSVSSKSVIDRVKINGISSPRKQNLTKISGKVGGNTSDIPSHTDYSSMDEDKSVMSAYSTRKIIRKFNMNPYNNFQTVKKFFIYQLKKSLLQAKKQSMSSVVHGNGNNDKAIYHEIFSNYSQINSTIVDVFVKYEDQNIRINNYYIYKNKLLGKGGYSSVYLCKNIKDKKEYAVKVTDKKVRANAWKKKYDYVKDEVIILKRLHSRYIVQVYEIMETEQESFIVMELMKNNSLFSKIDTLDNFKIWKYFRNLICGVEHCHEIAKIVHRDINVNNLLISNDDTLKLSDFGISFIINEGDDSISSITSGPCTYSPPERNSRNEFYGGRAADVWLIGLTLYHMVYQKPLFKKCGNITPEDYNIELPENKIMQDETFRELLTKLLDPNPETRCTIYDLRKNKWVTKKDEFPLPDVHEEALDYCYFLTSKEIEGVREAKESYIGEIKLLHQDNSLSPTEK